MLLAFGDPKLEDLDELVARRPPVITESGDYSYFAQFHMWLPQDAAGPRWAVVGNRDVPVERRQPSSFHLIHLRARPGDLATHANDWFEHFYEGSLRDPAADTRAQLDLAAVLPHLPGLWDGHFNSIPGQIARLLAEQIPAGETEAARAVLRLADRQLAASRQERRVGLELIDRLLMIASHPETPLTREQLMPVIGANARDLLPAIDAAWQIAPRCQGWIDLDSNYDHIREMAYINSRRLSDGTYVICGRTWSVIFDRRPSPSHLRRSPALDL